MTHITLANPHRMSRDSIGVRLKNYLRLARQRRDLARLDDRALEDIGVTRTEARTESSRPIWDAPENWCKQLY